MFCQCPQGYAGSRCGEGDCDQDLSLMHVYMGARSNRLPPPPLRENIPYVGTFFLFIRDLFEVLLNVGGFSLIIRSF